MNRIVLFCCLGQVALSLRLDREAEVQQSKENIYIRIQKTGSTSFGASLRGFTSVMSQGHFDWNSAMNNGFQPSHIFTLLRDPVERYLSEFSYIMWRPRIMLSQNMWDFGGHIYKDGERNRIMSIAADSQNSSGKLRSFVKEMTPTRNRQMLYLLGFHRVPCPSKPGWCRNQKHDDFDPTLPLPSETYNWDKDGAALLLKAQERLQSIHYGVTECMNATMRGIATEMGWDPDRAQEKITTIKVAHTHEESNLMRRRSEKIEEDDTDVFDFDPLVDSEAGVIEPELLRFFESMDHRGPHGQKKLARIARKEYRKWSDIFPADVVDDVRKLVNVEIKLYNYALDLFNRKHPESPCLAKKVLDDPHSPDSHHAHP